MLRASDAVSNQRTLGMTFFSNCTLSTADLIRFSTFAGKADAMMRLATTFSADVRKLVNERYVNTGLEDNITDLVDLMYSTDFWHRCLLHSSAIATHWDASMLSYLFGIIDDIRMNTVVSGIVQVNASPGRRDCVTF